MNYIIIIKNIKNIYLLFQFKIILRPFFPPPILTVCLSSLLWLLRGHFVLVHVLLVPIPLPLTPNPEPWVLISRWVALQQRKPRTETPPRRPRHVAWTANGRAKLNYGQNGVGFLAGCHLCATHTRPEIYTYIHKTQTHTHTHIFPILESRVPETGVPSPESGVRSVCMKHVIMKLTISKWLKATSTIWERVRSPG